MRTVSESEREAWTPRDTVRPIRVLFLLFRVGVAALCGAAFVWGLKAGWSDAAAWWHWGVIGASAAAIWSLSRGAMLTTQGPLRHCVGFALAAACLVVLFVISHGESALPPAVFNATLLYCFHFKFAAPPEVLIACAGWIMIALPARILRSVFTRSPMVEGAA